MASAVISKDKVIGSFQYRNLPPLHANTHGQRLWPRTPKKEKQKSPGESHPTSRAPRLSKTKTKTSGSEDPQNFWNGTGELQSNQTARLCHADDITDVAKGNPFPSSGWLISLEICGAVDVPD